MSTLGATCPTCGQPPTPYAGNPARTYLAKRSATTRADARSALDACARLLGGADAMEFPWEQLRYQHLLALRNALLQRVETRELRAGTANNRLRTVRSVLKEAWVVGAISNQEWAQLQSVPEIAEAEASQTQTVSPEEIAKLLEMLVEADRTTACHRARDRAIIATLYGTGLRRTELVALEPAHWRPAERLLAVVHGKGKKDREVPVPDWLLPLVGHWLEYRGMEPGALFCKLTKGGNVKGDRPGLQPDSLANILTRRCAQAEVRLHGPHAFRRAYATLLKAAGVPIEDIQDLLGHASPDTTKTYLRLNLQALRAGAARLPRPDQLRAVGAALNAGDLPDLNGLDLS